MGLVVGSNPKTMEAIRKAGLRLIFEHGYAAMSLRQLAAEGIEPLGREDSEFGRFAWLLDPEGNKIELWEPPEK